jgi:hypothetical protein
MSRTYRHEPTNENHQHRAALRAAGDAALATRTLFDSALTWEPLTAEQRLALTDACNTLERVTLRLLPSICEVQS